MPPSHLALSPALPSELLTYVLAHQVYPTTLIICQTRTAFLSSLLSCVPQPVQRQPPLLAPKDLPHEENEVQEEAPPESLHPLLIPTLHQVATSRSINLVFIPTVSHLRAYLAAFPSPNSKPSDGHPPKQELDRPGSKLPLLIIYGLVELHRDTSEWSAQGLGNSIAGLVGVAQRTERRVIVIEERGDEPTTGVEEEEDGQQVKHKPGRKAWDDKVPMLNGSVRRAGFESEDSAWSGRTIEVGRVLARWFKFGRGEWEFND